MEHRDPVRRAQRHGPDRRLAALDSARPLDGDVLVAEVDDEPVAAIDLHNGRAVANPWAPTAEAVRAAAAAPRAAAHRHRAPAPRRRHPFAAVGGLLR